MGDRAAGMTRLSGGPLACLNVLCLFVWVGGEGGGVSVVHHHSRNFARERRTKKQEEAEAGNKTTRTAVWISTLLGNVILSA